MNEDQKKTAAECDCDSQARAIDLDGNPVSASLFSCSICRKVEPHTVTVFELRADVQRLEVKCESLRQTDEAHRGNIARLEAQNANFRQANEAKHVEIAEMDRRHVDTISQRDREIAEYATRTIQLENDAAELRNRFEAYQVNSEDVIRDKQSKIEILQYELDVQKALVKALKEVFTLKI